MNTALRWIYNTLRATIMIVVVLLVLAYAAVYLGVSMPYFQNKIKAIVEREASKFLETDVTIDDISISPFNQVIVKGVKIPDQSGGDLIKVDKIGAGVSLYDLVVRRKVIINFAEIDGLHGTVTRPDKNSPTNLQFLIDKFKPKPDQPPKPYDITINNAIIRNSDLAYDVLNEPRKGGGRFDPNHVKITDLTADLVFPRIKNNDFVIDVNNLAFNEHNGLELRRLSGKFKVNDHRTEFADLVVELPGTKLSPSNTTFHYSSLKNAVNELKMAPLSLQMEDNYITPADFKTFEPKLATLTDPIHFSVDASSTFEQLDLRKLIVKSGNGKINLDVAGTATNYRSPDNLTLRVEHIDLNAASGEVLRLASSFATLPSDVEKIMSQSGTISVNGKNLSADLKRDNLLVESLKVSTHDGGIKLDLAGNFNNLRNVDELQCDVDHIDFSAQSSHVSQLAQTFTALPPQVQRLLNESGGIDVSGKNLSVDMPRDNLLVEDIKVSTHDGSLKLDLAGNFNNLRNINELQCEVGHIDLQAQSEHLAQLTHNLPTLPAQVQQVLNKSGEIKLNGKNLKFDVNSDNLLVENLNLETHNGNLKFGFAGNLSNLSNISEIQYDVNNINLEAQHDIVAQLAQMIPNLPPRVQELLNNSGNIKIDGSASGTLNDILANTRLSTAYGDVRLDGEFHNGIEKRVKGHVVASDLALGTLVEKKDLLGNISADLMVDGNMGRDSVIVGKLKGKVDYIDLKGYRYHNITADVNMNGLNFDGELAINDPNGKVNLDGIVNMDSGDANYSFNLVAQNVNLAKMNLTDKYGANNLNVKMSANLTGFDPNSIEGTINIDDASFINSVTGKGFHLNNLTVEANRTDYPQHIDISTDFLRGSIEGDVDFTTIVPAMKEMAAQCFPKFMNEFTQSEAGVNEFDFNFVIEPNEEFESYVSSYVHLPVKLLYKATLNGHFSEISSNFIADLNLPYLQQGNKIIEGTTVHVEKPEGDNNVMLSAKTIYPNKKGNISLNVDANAVNDYVDANVNWVLKRATDYHGDLNVSALLGRDDNGKFMTEVSVNPTQVVFNDTVWQVNQGNIKYENGVLDIDKLEGSCEDQFVRIAGRASHNPDDELKLSLKNIHLDYIFETLKINHVNFGGIATGEVVVADLFSGNPRLSTAPRLHVDNLYYNGAPMGDAEIESHFDSENTGVVLGCDLTQENGRHTSVNGEIFAASDSLYLEFDADKANVEFMKPFMAAFTDEVHGQVSGHAVLLGNFKTIDLKGDVFAEDFSLKVGYTNTTYSCTDSVHIEPGMIRFEDITITDRDKNTAKLNGWLKHDAFHNPEFNFTVTDARNLLCYDISPSMNDKWYGTIYGNGNAIIAGEPGEVRIDVNMESASRSKFTFVLSDKEEASEYNFITFRDRDKKDQPVAVVDTVPVENDTVPEIVRQLAKQIEQKQQQESMPSQFAIDLHVDITPEAEIVLVMDPVGGDRIRAYGSGNLRLDYNSIDDTFDMFGKYTLEKGSYNFTLQDIILKDFTIRDGSTISFDGDPYNAILDISAVYSLNANLSDLDASFSTDRDINRTNVPVNALLKVKGGISEPELSFDLEFPTLSSDVYRKIKSVISTEEMMNRQIIYLLALNRFYTPDYMQASKNNNELTSVASSTISSQISNLLGQLSENWQISPNLRSDKGDFSDVEFNLALSSQLLNNRLLFNGNFGYRDNTYNTRNSNFIGDFDLEYLLNRRGTIRLKAYNHFNDQNYYVRNAMTTQGVGVVFKHDFDRLFNKKKLQAPLLDTTRQMAPSLTQDTLLRFTSRSSSSSDTITSR